MDNYSEKLADHDRIFNGALEQAAIKLKQWYPDNEQTNAFCAAIRSLKK